MNFPGTVIQYFEYLDYKSQWERRISDLRILVIQEYVLASEYADIISKSGKANEYGLQVNKNLVKKKKDK